MQGMLNALSYNKLQCYRKPLLEHRCEFLGLESENASSQNLAKKW
jgi:hypothetical protein